MLSIDMHVPRNADVGVREQPGRKKLKFIVSILFYYLPATDRRRGRFKGPLEPRLASQRGCRGMWSNSL